jgi:phosphate transport system substrate-binding protein
LKINFIKFFNLYDKWKKYNFLFFLAFVCILLVLYIPKKIIEPAGNAVIQKSSRIRSTGSTSMSRLLNILGEEFTRLNPGIIYEKNETGSGAAILSVINNDVDLGDVSRSLKKDEISEKINRSTVALDGIAVIVNQENTIDNLTSDQLKDINESRIRDWSEISENNYLGKIIVIGRENSSGTRDGFESAFEIKDPQYDIILSESGDIAAKVGSEKTAIGYISFASASSRVRALKIDGIECNFENIRDKKYPAWRPFLQIYHKNSNNFLIKKWFDFLETHNAKKIIENERFVVSPNNN